VNPDGAPKTADSTQPVYRPTVRVVLMDDHDRLLMFSSTDDSDGHTFWFPVGGGLKSGETFEQAAVREVHEETGLEGVALGPEIWRTRLTASWGGQTYDQPVRFILARVPAFEIETSGFTESERVSLKSHHWWTLAELEATKDRLVPGDLATLMATLLAEGPPAVSDDLDARAV
jgi:8-oxo-dGTP pyrophosphatase MutT (NUDIX family)